MASTLRVKLTSFSSVWLSNQASVIWSNLAGLLGVCLLTVPHTALPVITQRTCYFGNSAEKRWQHHALLKLLTFPQALPAHPRIYTLVLLLSLLLRMHWLHFNGHRDGCAPAKHSCRRVVRRKTPWVWGNSRAEWRHRGAGDNLISVHRSGRLQKQQHKSVWWGENFIRL